MMMSRLITKGRSLGPLCFYWNKNSMEVKQRLLSATQAANYLGVDTKTLWEWVNTGLIPQVKFPGRRPRYDIQDLDKLIEENKKMTDAAMVYQGSHWKE